MTRAVVAAAGLVALALVMLIAGTGPADRLEQRAVDTRFDLRGENPTDDLVVIAIDDKTLGQLQQAWPIPRRFHALAIDSLREAGVRQIVYDVQFTEKSASASDDRALLEAVERTPGIVLATAESSPDGRTRVLGNDRKRARLGASVGAAALPAEQGGVVRRYTRRAGPLDSLATVTASVLGSPVEEEDFRDGAALIDFAGPAGTVATYSMSDLVAGQIDTQVLRDRIAVVGVTTPTIQDRFPTSAGGRRMSEPEIQANAIRTALDGNPLRETPGWVEYALILVAGGLAVLAIGSMGPLRGVAGAVVIAAALALGSYVAFNQDLVVPVAMPLVGVAVATVAALLAVAARAVTERRHASGRANELEDAVRARTADLELTNVEAVNRLARAAEMRDGGTGEHLDRMSRLCELVSLELGQSQESAGLLRQAAVLHDVGKIGLPDRILGKPGKLTPEEIDVMRRHAAEGAALLDGSRSPLISLAEVVAATHHERWDGTGYPNGLSGDEIPLPGRIAAVCDVFDALITERPYKHAWTVAEARAEIVSQRGKHFDPSVADALLRVVDRDDGSLALASRNGSRAAADRARTRSFSRS